MRDPRLRDNENTAPYRTFLDKAREQTLVGGSVDHAIAFALVDIAESLRVIAGRVNRL